MTRMFCRVGLDHVYSRLQVLVIYGPIGRLFNAVHMGLIDLATIKYAKSFLRWLRPIIKYANRFCFLLCFLSVVFFVRACFPLFLFFPFFRCFLFLFLDFFCTDQFVWIVLKKRHTQIKYLIFLSKILGEYSVLSKKSLK